MKFIARPIISFLMKIPETFADKVASPQAQARMFLEEDDEDNKVCTLYF